MTDHRPVAARMAQHFEKLGADDDQARRFAAWARYRRDGLFMALGAGLAALVGWVG